MVAFAAAGSLIQELAACVADTNGLAPRECQFAAAVQVSVI